MIKKLAQKFFVTVIKSPNQGQTNITVSTLDPYIHLNAFLHYACIYHEAKPIMVLLIRRGSFKHNVDHCVYRKKQFCYIPMLSNK